MSEQERRVVVPGGELAVFDHGGSGPDVLLVHSVCHSSPVWDDVIAALGGQARLVTVDLRGHGHSTAPAGDVDEIPADLVRVVEALELRRPVLVGHDVGGGFVAAVAADRPDLLGGLVVVDSPVVEEQAAVRALVETVGAETIVEMLTQRFGLGQTGPDEASREAFVDARSPVNAADLLSPSPDEAGLRRLLEHATVTEPSAPVGSWVFRPTPATVRALTRDPGAAAFQPGRELLADLEVPVAVVIASNGRNGTGGQGLLDLAAAHPNVQLVHLDTGPHSLYTNADDVADAIREVLARRDS